MRAKRGLGQNFLVGSHYPQRIIKSVSPQAGETIIEIGPGQGALTKLLVESGASVIAIEIDQELISLLRERFEPSADLRLIEADALKLDLCPLLGTAAKARVVANLPYYISTPILQRLIEQRRCISEMTLMLQRDLVERIVAEPGGKERGYLSVFAQFYCETEKLFDVPPGAFRPTPKVWSSVLRLRILEEAARVEDEDLFIELIKVLFSQRRKTILNNLRAGKQRIGLKADVQIADLLGSERLDPQRRAETLTIDEIAGLTNAVIKLL